MLDIHANPMKEITTSIFPKMVLKPHSPNVIFKIKTFSKLTEYPIREFIVSLCNGCNKDKEITLATTKHSQIKSECNIYCKNCMNKILFANEL